MKRIFSYVAMIGLMAWTMTACNNDSAPDGPIPESFPKKNLIEEFTGQDCGYCPDGMDVIHQFIANDTNWVLLLHHYGYKADHFSVSGSKTITSALGVSGAPSMAINRAKTKYYGSQSAIVFSPGYLEYTKKTQFETTTYASIVLDNTYDAATRELRVRVSGAISKADYPQLYLTVVVKESGMVDYQQDNYKTYAGWQEFRHANAVRAFLTPAKGEEVNVNGNRRYSAVYSITLNEKWVAENCMVVAFLSEDFQPVVQAEQQPVVAGTTGGADILHGGITPVPVSDFFPEPDDHSGPADLSGHETDTLTYASSVYQPYTSYGFNFWNITAYNRNVSYRIGNTACVPYLDLYLFTETSQTTIPAGTYPLETSMNPGTAYAGFRDDSNIQISGSEFYYINKSYFNQGYLVPVAEWLIADGELTITEEGWELAGHARNGADIHLVGTTAIVNKGKASAPAHRTSAEPSGQPIENHIGMPAFSR